MVTEDGIRAASDLYRLDRVCHLLACVAGAAPVSAGQIDRSRALQSTGPRPRDCPYRPDRHGTQVIFRTSCGEYSPDVRGGQEEPQNDGASIS